MRSEIEPSTRACEQETAGYEGCGHADAVGEHEQRPEPGPTDRGRAEQDDDRGRSRYQTTGEPEREQRAPGWPSRISNALVIVAVVVVMLVVMVVVVVMVTVVVVVMMMVMIERHPPARLT